MLLLLLLVVGVGLLVVGCGWWLLIVGCWLLVVGCGGGGGGGGASLQNGNHRAGSLGNLEEFPIGRFGLKKRANKKHKTPSTRHLI